MILSHLDHISSLQLELVDDGVEDGDAVLQTGLLPLALSVQLPQHVTNTRRLSSNILHNPHKVLIFSSLFSRIQPPGLLLLGLHPPGLQPTSKRQSPERGLSGPGRPGRPGRHSDRRGGVLILRGGVAVSEVVVLQVGRQRTLEGPLDPPGYHRAGLDRRLSDTGVDVLLSLEASLSGISRLDYRPLEFSDPGLHLTQSLSREIVSALIKVTPFLREQKEDIIGFLLV